MKDNSVKSISLKDKYGTRRGFYLTQWYRLLFVFGRYKRYNNIDWQSVERLVFVCKGNICRSAYAEAIAKSLGVNAISCGIRTKDSVPANKGARLAAKRLGMSLEEHRTTSLKCLKLAKTDLLIVMEPWQASHLIKVLPDNYQYTLLGLWSNPVLPHIQDPYGSSDDYFDNCFHYIEDAVKSLVNHIKK